jgi:hypothetical protein
MAIGLAHEVLFNAAETTQIAFSLLCAAQAVFPSLQILWRHTMQKT